MNYFEAIVLAIIEGLTEFLPVSSTGHMIIASSFMGIASDPFVKLFTIAIQLGAILSVLVLYFKRFFKSINFYIKLLVAFIPAAVFGLLLSKKIDELLENPLGVAAALFVGGVVLLFIDKLFKPDEANEITHSDIKYKNAFIIGMFQVISLFPGVSRSAATIIGGLSQKLNRKAAAEFSFFLAVPTMFAATGYKLLKFFHTEHHRLEGDQLNYLLLGNLIAFLVAMLAIRTFIGYLSKHGFRIFGIYRIVLAVIIFVLYFMNVPMASV